MTYHHLIFLDLREATVRRQPPRTALDPTKLDHNPNYNNNADASNTTDHLSIYHPSSAPLAQTFTTPEPSAHQAAGNQ